jgi:hypothetical protein
VKALPVTLLATPLATLLLLAATPALADAVGAFHDGKWASVIAQGHAEATPAALVLAGRAQLAIACYETRDKARALDLLGLAERDFDAALAKTPGNAGAQLQKAIVIGYRAKLTKSPGLARDARNRFEAIRTAQPGLATAWAAVAGWHGGSIATLGSFLAGTVLGAKSGEVDKGFAQAIRLEPNNPVHRLFYAHTLLDLDPGNAAKAAGVLQGLDRLPADDGFEALLRAQGTALAAAIRGGDAKAAQALARRQAPFGTIV